jgi:tetratricopeptide (TPR) repeat protein
MKYVKILFLIAAVSIFWACGSNPAEKGEKAFQEGNYNIAIKHFVEAKSQNPADQSYAEKIALSYMYRGKELFGMRRNLKAYSGNFEKASDFIPDNPSPEFKKQYSEILYDLSQAYMKTKPNNEIEKEEFLNKAIEYLEEALYQNAQNTVAEEYLNTIKSDNFQKMLDKGNDFYEKARKSKNYDLYFSAEYYFKKASYFDIHNTDAKNMLSKTREKTLSVLNFREDLAMAVADYTYQSGNFIMDLTMKNFMRNPVPIDINNFELVDSDGNTYPVNTSIMKEKFSKKSIKNVKLAELKTVDGIIAFAVPKKVNFDYVAYNLPDGKSVKKYIP